MTQVNTFEDITDHLQRFKTQIKHTGCEAIAGLEKLAEKLSMDELAKQLKVVNDQFRSDTFKLIVVGRFKTGKSSLINAMLGKTETEVVEVDTQMGPMPVDDLPATATLTRISYAEKPYVRVRHKNGDTKEWTLAQYHREAVLRGSEKENQEFFENIVEFEVGYPARLCKYATLLDSPGTDEAPRRTAITTQAVRECDAAIVVFRHEPFAGQKEREWVAENILDTGVRVFTVVNLWMNNGKARVVDERLRSLVWDKLVRDMLNGDEYSGQDFTSKDIFFVCAKQAGEAKFNNNPQLYEESGMALFEQRLTDFLLKEREETHVTRFVKATELHVERMIEQIAQRRAALQADCQKLQRTTEVLQPRLEEIRARRDKLPKILDRYRRESESALADGFDRMILQLRLDLPSLVKNKPLNSLKGIGNTIKAHFTKKAISEEAAEICMDTIRHRINVWCKNPPEKDGAQRILQPIVQRMVDEVTDEVVSIQTSFRELHFDLTGYTPAISKDPKNNILSRIAGIVGGILLHDVGLIAGGAGGLRGFAGTLGGYLVGGLMAGLMGLSLPVAVPVILVSGLLAGMGVNRMGLEGRIWDHACKQADEALSKLPVEARTAIQTETAKTFDKLTTAIMADAGSIIEQEEQNLRSVLALNQQDQQAKSRSLRDLDDAEVQIGQFRKQLNNVLVMVKQISGQERSQM